MASKPAFLTPRHNPRVVASSWSKEVSTSGMYPCSKSLFSLRIFMYCKNRERVTCSAAIYIRLPQMLWRVPEAGHVGAFLFSTPESEPKMTRVFAVLPKGRKRHMLRANNLPIMV